jgi:hypothetical protein
MLNTLRMVEGYHTHVYDGNICRDGDSSVLRSTVSHRRYFFYRLQSKHSAKMSAFQNEGWRVVWSSYLPIGQPVILSFY